MHQAVEPPAARTGAGIRCLRDTRGLAPRHGPARRTSDPGRRPSPYTGPRPGRSGPGATHCRMVPTPALSKPRLPVPSRHLGCALTLQTECLRLQPRNPAASITFSGYPSTLHQSDQQKSSLNSEQKRKANLSLFTYRNTEGECKTSGSHALWRGRLYLAWNTRRNPTNEMGDRVARSKSALGLRILAACPGASGWKSQSGHGPSSRTKLGRQGADRNRDTLAVLRRAGRGDLSHERCQRPGSAMWSLTTMRL